MEQHLTAEIISKEPLAPNVLDFRVRLVEPSAVVFKAGQFMIFDVGKTGRAYSIVSAPTDRLSELHFCIQIIPGGVGSTFVQGLKVGDSFTMRGPFGIFTVDDFERDAFFVATGVGIAPFKAMITDMLARGYKRSVHLLFGLRQEADIFYHNDFVELSRQHPNFIFLPSFSQPSAAWQGLAGRVTSFLEQNYAQFGQCKFYVCGGRDMVKDTRTLLLERGYPPTDIKVEVF